jgi:SM-20-related protein
MPALGFFQELGLFFVPAFLDPEASVELCREMATAPVEKALITGPSGEDRLDEDSRKVESTVLPKSMRSPLKQRLCALLPELEKHFGVELVGCESPQYLIYHRGDFFKPHTDGGGSQIRDGIRRRRVSAVIFLNRESEEPAEETYGQGQLTFYSLLEGPQWERCVFPLHAEPGLLVAFPSDKLHEVTPVSHGKRFTVVTWFYGPDLAAVPEGAD